MNGKSGSKEYVSSLASRITDLAYEERIDLERAAELIEEAAGGGVKMPLTPAPMIDFDAEDLEAFELLLDSFNASQPDDEHIETYAQIAAEASECLKTLKQKRGMLPPVEKGSDLGDATQAVGYEVRNTLTHEGDQHRRRRRRSQAA